MFSSLSYSASPAGGLITINGTGTALQFAATNTGPSISQADTSGAGVDFTLIAQNTTTSTTNAGNINRKVEAIRQLKMVMILALVPMLISVVELPTRLRVAVVMLILVGEETLLLEEVEDAILLA